VTTGPRPAFSAFAAARDSTFTLEHPDGPLALVLVEATPYGGPGAPCDDADDPPSFTLLFRGPAEPQLAQGTRPLRHARLGALEIFLVPVGRDADGMRYEAVFG
jgi:hypothetical protein